MITIISMYNFLISVSGSDQFREATIHHRSSKLKINAFNLTSFNFTPSKGEIRFFVTSGQEKLVFETRGYKRHREVLILHMISWYCLYRGLNEPQIHTALPLAS